MKKIPTTEEIQDAMLHVFDRATKTRGLDILGAIVPHTFDPVRAIWNVPDHEAEELCRFVNQFTTYVTKGHDAPALTRLRLVVYCHILEAETPQAVIWNLLRLIGGQQPSWTFSTPGRNGDQPCEMPEQRMAEIKRLSEPLNEPIGTVLYALWHNKLRNAFLHAQYTLFSRGDFVGTKTISPLTANAVRESDKADASGENPTAYTASEVEQLYNAALEYLWALTKCYEHGSAAFKDGRCYDLPSGPIRWNEGLGWWSPQ
jgi:hypothetical protein